MKTKNYFILLMVIGWMGKNGALGRDFRELAPMPPMGWNSWYCMGSEVNEAAILATAEAMVNSGMKDAGYEYVVIDDSWQKGKVENGTYATLVEGRDADGTLLANPETFPNGIAAVADYVHGLGLKFGIYTGPGPRTCGGYTGSMGYEKKDLETFAAWGVDFIKLDWCGCKGSPENVLAPWRTILDSLDRPIVLSVNAGRRYGFLRTVANLWRTTGDIAPVWEHPPEMERGCPSIRNVIESQAGLEEYNGPGGWNDPDILQVGREGLTEEESRTHFTMWAMLGAPLIAGNDLRTMSDSVREILTNREVIALNQDPLGYQARKITESQKGLQVWVKKLQKPTECAAAFLNHSLSAAEITLNLCDLGIREKAFARDLWKHKDLGLIGESYTVTVPAHGVVVLKLSAWEEIKPVLRYPVIGAEGAVFEAEAPENMLTVGSFQKAIAGFYGTGYAVRTRPTDNEFRLTIMVPSGKSGRYRCTVRYSFAGEKAVTCGVRVNETRKQDLEIVPGKVAGEWCEASCEVDLAERVNHICITAGREENGAAFDRIRILPLQP